ncbi:DedA family protein [Metabacillus sp. GX 13764]|uniref:DedA family protein n=1 Tax=Metabacillus kandeliae TaxID=2900151 RepID=UPI001E51B2B5|nr:DedA family protein [Metabacillus kandeliae]MCD7036304.1 DedA family protein [Metabacillus kandeliae]
MGNFVYSILDWLAGLGYFGVALGLMIEIIPSEIVLGYGGYLISLGKINFIGALIAGTIGGTIAQLFLYWIGAYGGRPFLEKYGRFLLIRKKHLDLSEKWFEKYGPGVIFSARFIPVVRHAISIPAGIAKMPVWHFIGYTVGAIVPWTILFLYLGMSLGSDWKEVKEKAQPFVMPLIIIFVVVMIVYIFIKRRSKKETV